MLVLDCQSLDWCDFFLNYRPCRQC